MSGMSKRTTDLNGYVEVEGNPIAKAGIFPYLGREINAPEANRIYFVLRAPEELQDAETIESFKLIPFIDDHEMLGEHATPAERKGIQGVTGERVFYDEPYLKANLRILSESAWSLIESKQKIQLSPGYRAKYDFTPGVWNGQPYDARQHTIRANHLALVKDGRSGADVAVQDHAVFTLDTAELLKMTLEEMLEAIKALTDEDKAKLLAALKPTDTTDEDGEMTAEERASAEQAADAAEAASEAAATAAAAAETASDLADEAATTGNPDIADEAAAAAETASEAAEQATELADTAADTLDSKALLKRVVALEKKLKAQQGATMDSGALIRTLGQRDSLAQRVSHFVGTFDHASMTLQQVAEYGVKKLNIRCPKGQETMALDVWMQGRTPESKQPSISTMDSATGSHDRKAKLFGDKK